MTVRGAASCAELALAHAIGTEHPRGSERTRAPRPGKQEQPIKRLPAWMEGRSMADREREVVTVTALVEPARVTLGSTIV